MSSKSTKKRERKYSEYLKIDEINHITLRQCQKEYQKTILENHISLCYGSAGTSKTFTAVYTGLLLLAERKVNQIILTKPIQESGEKLGYLPGDVSEKINPYLQSFIDSMNKILKSKKTVEWLFTTKAIIFEPLAYMRGRTFDDAFCFLDEAQNCDFRQLMLFCTRKGKNSKIVISGDISQYDIDKNKVALPDFIKMIEDVKSS